MASRENVNAKVSTETKNLPSKTDNPRRKKFKKRAKFQTLVHIGLPLLGHSSTQTVQEHIKNVQHQTLEENIQNVQDTMENVPQNIQNAQEYAQNVQEQIVRMPQQINQNNYQYYTMPGQQLFCQGVNPWQYYQYHNYRTYPNVQQGLFVNQPQNVNYGHENQFYQNQIYRNQNYPNEDLLNQSCPVKGESYNTEFEDRTFRSNQHHSFKNQNSGVEWENQRAQRNDNQNATHENLNSSSGNRGRENVSWSDTQNSNKENLNYEDLASGYSNPNVVCDNLRHENVCYESQSMRHDNANTSYENMGYENQSIGYKNQSMGYDNPDRSYGNENMGSENQNMGSENQNMGFENQNMGFENQNMSYENLNMGCENQSISYEHQTMGYDNISYEDPNLSFEARSNNFPTYQVFEAQPFQPENYFISDGVFHQEYAQANFSTRGAWPLYNRVYYIKNGMAYFDPDYSVSYVGGQVVSNPWPYTFFNAPMAQYPIQNQPPQFGQVFVEPTQYSRGGRGRRSRGWNGRGYVRARGNRRDRRQRRNTFGGASNSSREPLPGPPIVRCVYEPGMEPATATLREVPPTPNRQASKSKRSRDNWYNSSPCKDGGGVPLDFCKNPSTLYLLPDEEVFLDRPCSMESEISLSIFVPSMRTPPPSFEYIFDDIELSGSDALAGKTVDDVQGCSEGCRQGCSEDIQENVKNSGGVNLEN